MAKKKTELDPLSLILEKLTSMETRLTELESKPTEQQKSVPVVKEEKLREPTQEELDKWIPIFKAEGLEFIRRYHNNGSFDSAIKASSMVNKKNEIVSSASIDQSEARFTNREKVPPHLSALRKKIVNGMVAEEVARGINR